ncbi:hypothetical protein KP509_37G045500 [Ceratopteris richardii]|nr:hypothetical protein KP509_37G045500 [Ceratopteris richardii]
MLMCLFCTLFMISVYFTQMCVLLRHICLYSTNLWCITFLHGNKI